MSHFFDLAERDCAPCVNHHVIAHHGIDLDRGSWRSDKDCVLVAIVARQTSYVASSDGELSVTWFPAQIPAILSCEVIH